MLITKTRYDREIAKKDVEIADLQERRLNAKKFLEQAYQREKELRHDVWALENEVIALKARLEAADKISDALHVKLWEADKRLAPFKRTRGKGGRFVKVGAGQ